MRCGPHSAQQQCFRDAARPADQIQMLLAAPCAVDDALQLKRRQWVALVAWVESGAAQKNWYTSRFVRVILAQGPC